MNNLSLAELVQRVVKCEQLTSNAILEQGFLVDVMSKYLGQLW